jgi:tryptophan synthase beta chain
VTRLEGIIPALETAHALHWALLEADSSCDVVCCSGRGDKDLAEVLAQS